MDLLEQCRIWNENDEYQKIIDAIEAIPESELTPEFASELARAYNNAADVEDKEYFEKSVNLLKPYEEYFERDHCWNFRIAYAYYYLDQEGLALHYFGRANWLTALRVQIQPLSSVSGTMIPAACSFWRTGPRSWGASWLTIS